MPIDGLDHVGLAVADRAMAERFFGETLGLQRSAEGLFQVGRTAFELLEVSPETGPLGRARLGITHLALRVPDLAQAVAEADRRGLPTTRGDDGAPAVAGPTAWLDPEATAAVRICLIERRSPAAPSAPGADGLLERIDHIGVASLDNARARRSFAAGLGLPVESEQTDTEVRVATEIFVSDKYGVVAHTRPAVAVGGLRVLFVTVGDCELEFLQDFAAASERAAGQAGSTKRDQGAIARFIATRGAGPHHVALKVRDLDAMLRRLESQRIELIDRQGRPGSRRARIAFLNPQATQGVLFHLVEREAAGRG